MKGLGDQVENNIEKIDSNRKKIARLQSELDALGRRTSSQMENYGRAESLASLNDSKDDVDADALQKLAKQIQRVEGNLIRRIAAVEGSVSRISDLED